ncbi:MAG: hypothetical protein SF052_22335 [Bacteroidia bacterium]|nr:hypothetical protein [Bacteroidia bacterium]
MKLIKFMLESLIEILKIAVYKWAMGFIFVTERYWKLFKLLKARRRLPHTAKNATNTKCSPIHHPSFHRPDPLIYSQKYLQSLGLPVTWDNPDIVLRKDGAIVSENNLLPDTDYEIDATIWNNSYDAPVVGLKVYFSYLSFGVGGTAHTISKRAINLGVKGGANHPAHASVIWRTPNVGGHYCLQVFLNCPDDLNPANNLGQNNVNVAIPQSPAMFTFQVRNETKVRQEYAFKVDTYTLPSLKECRDKDEKRPSNDQKWREIQAVHYGNGFPIPPGWAVDIAPVEIVLMPEETSDVSVKITPPADFTGKKGFNVNAMNADGKFMGGVTLYVEKT